MNANSWNQRRYSRRSIIRGTGGVAAGGALAALLAACGGSDSKTATNATSAAGTAATTGSTGAAGSAQPTGQLRMAHWEGPETTDPTKADSPDLIMAYGMAETLMRTTPDVKVAPWLAERVETVDGQTTRIQLRKDVTFWDGSPVDSAAVKASLERTWANVPAADPYISKQTQVTTPDPLTVMLKTPGTQGNVLNFLAQPFFIIHKAAGSDVILSGAYKPLNITPDQSVSLEPYAKHWGAKGQIKKIDVKIVPDANTRALALQSGDADFAWQIPVEQVDQLKSQFTIVDLPSLRVSLGLFNVSRPPFDDVAVRKALTLGVDRDAIVKGVLLGAGKVANGAFPSGYSIDVVDTQKLDLNQAKSVLDGAGWTAGSDGVRQKNGQRLSFTALTYPGRPELRPISIAIQSQLKPLGFDMRPQEVPSISAATKKDDWGLGFASINTLPTADPQYLYDFAFVTGGGFNLGKYSNPTLDGMVRQLRGEVEPAKRVALSKQIQELLGQDVPALYTINKQFKAGLTKKVQGFQVQPNDFYLITPDLRISS